ncbi:hypothetical protein QFZ76_009507 [Streptomyces sp. V4I2]|nr:hypothetical protein [Streptomyces sp. V4I2]
MITTPNGPVRLEGESGMAARLFPVTVTVTVPVTVDG